MREIKILEYCDICYIDHGETRTYATKTWTIGLVDSESRPVLYTLSTCEPHGKTYEESQKLLALLPRYVDNPQARAVSQPPLFTRAASKDPEIRNGPPSRYVTVSCEVCDAQPMSRGALVNHIWSKHRSDTKPAAPSKCPDCNYESSTAGIGVHRMNAHGYDVLAEAYAGVKGKRPEYRGKVSA